MPRNGIAVTVSFPDPSRLRYPPLTLIIPKTPSTTLEGAPGTPEYRIKGRVNGRNVLVVEDILDSGLTLSWLLKNLSSRGPASVEVFTLLRKPDAHSHTCRSHSHTRTPAA